MPFTNDGDDGDGREGGEPGKPRRPAAGVKEATTVVGRQVAGAMPVIEEFTDATLDNLERRSVQVAEAIVRNTIAPRIELLRADMRQFTRESEQRGAELIQRTTAQLSEAVDRQLKAARDHVGDALTQLDAIVERRISSVEHESLRTIEAAVTRVVSSSAKEVEHVLDGIYRRLLGVAIPISALIVASNVRKTFSDHDTATSAILRSWAAAGLMTGALGLARLLQAAFSRARTMSIGATLWAWFLDLFPFIVAGLVLGVVASLF
jgi:hypothetical protein